MATIESITGIFGEISIIDSLDPSVRVMKINNEIEGQVFFSPDATSFSCSTLGPGAVAASSYLYAFIILAWKFSNTHGLMLGLGAGIGATMLLSLFPNLRLTVVELDPQVILLAKKYFPLINFYENNKRLRIVQADANKFLDQPTKDFEFVLLDLFAGNENNLHDIELINKALKVAPYFMANFISSQKQLPQFERFFWFSVMPAFSFEKANWILTNIDAISPDIYDYQLFAHLSEHENVITANNYFNYILSQIDAAFFYR